ncbi:hypothetical protein LJC07_06910 [Christensenellaceae bacterium OttesenSCG-928-L17]|nr:hypothetical protein [Christensenellaceae bacterium OttesenSCG-928-L17]
MKRLSILCVVLLLLPVLCAGCGAGQENGEPDTPQILEIQSAAELAAWFESGPTEARITNNIDMGGDMLTLRAGRGVLQLYGGGHTLSGNAPSLIRLEDGAGLYLEEITLEAKQIAVGLLGSGQLGGKSAAIHAALNAIHAAGALTIANGSTLSVSSEEGAGIFSVGLTVQKQAALTVSGSSCAIHTNEGDLVLESGATIACEAGGDHAVRTDDILQMDTGAVLTAINTNEYAAVRANSLAIAPGARMEATGGENGVGLFVVEQHEDIDVLGFSVPDASCENGRGSITFHADALPETTPDAGSQ